VLFKHKFREAREKNMLIHMVSHKPTHRLGWTSKLLLILLAGILLTACSTPYRPPDYSSRPDHHTEFRGLLDLAQDAPRKTLDVLLVHGMCTHELNWAVNTIEALREAAGAQYENDREPADIQLGGIQIYQRTLKASTGKLRMNAIVWSPLVAGLKKQLCYDQTKKTELCRSVPASSLDYPYQRARINATMKDGLLNDCLADAIIYQGRARDEISKQLQQAILAALANSGGPMASTDPLRSADTEPANLVVITESLGSKMAFDALYQLLQSDQNDVRVVAANTFGRTVQIFMGANQIPILALGDQTLDGSSGAGRYLADPLAELIHRKRIGTLGDHLTPPRVVAFTDPNDLLSYVLAPYKPPKPYDVVDVVVSNDDTYLGLIENPMTAHMGYRKNGDVIRSIVCGYPARTACSR
jgi:hypothetical protein